MIEVEHLSKTYGSTAAIADVSFSVESGEILGFLGPNGAGKTTTMRILSGYLPASSGTARIAGMDVHENSMAVRQRIGYLPENPPLYPEMTVEGFLFFVARIKQVPAGDRARRVTSAIERCGLVDKRKVLIRKLSKGFRQRVGIAQAIVHDPPVIILDEPTVGLDPRQIIEVRNLIKSLGGQHTIILSTHILPEVSMTCNRVTIINRGKIAAAGTPDNLMGEFALSEGYELEVEGEADLVNSLLLPSLENLPGVRSVELIPSQQFLVNRYRLRALCEPEREPGREIATAILASGFGLCEMRRSRATLEDVFLRLTAAEKKPEENLVHSEPEVARNLQEAAEIQDSIADAHQSQSQPTIADAHQSQSQPIGEYLPVSDTQESIEHPQPASEPIAETVESQEHPQPEPIVETLEVSDRQESLENPQPEPIVETLEVSDRQESLENPQPEPIVDNLLVVETVESLENPQPEPIVESQESIDYSQPESEPIAETPEEISDLEPGMQPVAAFLEIVQRQESLENPQPEPVVENLLVVETVESPEHPQPEPVVETVESLEHPQPEPVVENLLVVETVESLEHPQPEPVVETVESLEHPQPEPIVENLLVVETVELPEPSQPEPVVQNLLVVETVELPEPSQPEPVVENLLVVETVELPEPSQPEPVVENLL